MAQTPRDCTGDFSGREQLIPAVYNVASLADQISVLPNEESVNAVLSGRSASAQQSVSIMQLPFPLVCKVLCYCLIIVSCKQALVMGRHFDQVRMSQSSKHSHAAHLQTSFGLLLPVAVVAIIQDVPTHTPAVLLPAERTHETKMCIRRSPALFPMNTDMTTGTAMSFLDNLTGNLTATTALTPACAAIQQVQPLAPCEREPL